MIVHWIYRAVSSNAGVDIPFLTGGATNNIEGVYRMHGYEHSETEELMAFEVSDDALEQFEVGGEYQLLVSVNARCVQKMQSEGITLFDDNTIKSDLLFSVIHKELMELD